MPPVCCRHRGVQHDIRHAHGRQVAISQETDACRRVGARDGDVIECDGADRRCRRLIDVAAQEIQAKQAAAGRPEEVDVRQRHAAEHAEGVEVGSTVVAGERHIGKAHAANRGRCVVGSVKGQTESGVALEGAVRHREPADAVGRRTQAGRTVARERRVLDDYVGERARRRGNVRYEAVPGVACGRHVVEREVAHRSAGQKDTAVVVARAARRTRDTDVPEHLPRCRIDASRRVDDRGRARGRRGDDRVGGSVTATACTDDRQPLADRHVLRIRARRHQHHITGVRCRDALRDRRVLAAHRAAHHDHLLVEELQFLDFRDRVDARAPDDLRHHHVRPAEGQRVVGVVVRERRRVDTLAPGQHVGARTA